MIAFSPLPMCDTAQTFFSRPHFAGKALACHSMTQAPRAVRAVRLVR